MKRICLIFLGLFFLFQSCASMKDLDVPSQAKKVKVGMTKDEVLSTMGSRYEPFGARRLGDVLYEEYVYNGYHAGYYHFLFENEVLVEWYRQLEEEPFMVEVEQ